MGIVEVFGMICLTSLTGSFYFLCWLLVERILDRSGLIEENLIFLYMGLFFFTVPVLYAILRMMAMEADGAIVGTFLTPTPFILNLVRKIGWIWLAGMCTVSYTHLLARPPRIRWTNILRRCKEKSSRPRPITIK